MRKYIFISLIGLAGCSLFTPAQQQDIAAQLADQAACTQADASTCIAALGANVDAKGAEGCAASAALKCIGEHPLKLPAPAAQ